MLFHACQAARRKEAAAKENKVARGRTARREVRLLAESQYEALAQSSAASYPCGLGTGEAFGEVVEPSNH